MITAIIIDDEPRGRLALWQKIKNYCPEVELLGEAGDGIEGKQLIEKLQPDVVFLDIEMPEMNGFDMLQKIGRKKFHLIFTTAYNHYAIKAIRFAAFDYLLKPIDIDELRAAVARISLETNASGTSEQLTALQHNLRHKYARNKIAIADKAGMHLFDVDGIVYIEAQSNYSVFYFRDGSKVTASKTLKEFEELLPGDLFFRPHHSHLINLYYVRKYIKGDGGQLEMANGKLLDVARRRKDDLLRLLKG